MHGGSKLSPKLWKVQKACRLGTCQKTNVRFDRYPTTPGTEACHERFPESRRIARSREHKSIQSKLNKRTEAPVNFAAPPPPPLCALQASSQDSLNRTRVRGGLLVFSCCSAHPAHPSSLSQQITSTSASQSVDFARRGYSGQKQHKKNGAWAFWFYVLASVFIINQSFGQINPKCVGPSGIGHA